MDDAAADQSLLEALQRSDRRGLYDLFASFLLPFGDLVPLQSHNPDPASARKGTSTSSSAATSAAPKKRGPKKKKQETSTEAVRPLAKRFVPFIRSALNLLSSLLRRDPKSPNPDLDDLGAAQLFSVYRLLLDCLACLGPCLVGKPYTVHLRRVRLVVCLEAWGRYVEAEEEALMLLESLSSILVDAAPVPKSRKGTVSAAACYIPDPALVGADDPEITKLVVEVIAVLAGCAYKSKIRKEVAYDRIMVLTDEVQPWLRFLDPEASPYRNFLANTLYKCSLFLLEDCVYFEGEIVQHFCLTALKEYTNSCSINHFPSIVRKITSSVDMQWSGGKSLLLNILRITLESILCSCKVDLLKHADQLLEFVSYFSSRICANNADICRNAATLLYEQGDALQVSPPVASILAIYATGLQFKFSINQASQSGDNLHVPNDGYRIMLFDGGGVDLQKFSVLLNTLASGFTSDLASEIILCNGRKNSRNVLVAASKTGMLNVCMQTHGRVSLISYIDALRFLCKPIVEFVSSSWKNLDATQEAVFHSETFIYGLMGLHQFSDLMLSVSSCSDISERVEQQLNESHGTLLQVAVAAFKISLITGERYQKSLLVVKYVISSTWIEPQELKFLISSINNIGAVCYNSGLLEKASKALQLCIEIIWAYVKVIRGICSSKEKGIQGDNTAEDGDEDAINGSLTKIATIIDFLYKCGPMNFKEIFVKSLYELSATKDISHVAGLLTLMKQWVKIVCKEFKDADTLENTPVLCSLLLDCDSTLSKDAMSKMLEQELVAYEQMESRKPNLCQKMGLKIMDILLNDMYVSKEYNLHRSRNLIKKGRVFRARGTEGLSKCLECLSEAISLLRSISGDPSEDTDLVAHYLALTHILYAQCVQEANQDCNVILHNVHCALDLWSGMNVQSQWFTNNCPEWGYALPMLCSIVDLMSLKVNIAYEEGCLKYQIDLCKVIVRFCIKENVVLDKCISMLWMSRRLNHSLCSSPIDEVFISNISEQCGININSLDYWINCMKDHPPLQCMLLQKLVPSDFIISEPSRRSLEIPSVAEINIEEVRKMASSLVSEVPLTSQSAFLAACLYHDLSEKLFSNGRFFEALSYAKEALHLRNSILRRKFAYTIELLLKSEPDRVTQSGNDRIYLEAVSSAITDVWPDQNKSGNPDEYILSPWIVLRCYLESTMQVGIIHESIGNGTEAEYFFRIGKEITHIQGFPVLAIAFTVLLGRIYRKKELWDMAESEFKYAKKLLVDYENVLSCDHCKMIFEAVIDMEAGDLARNLFGKGVQKSAGRLSHALSLYRLALEKLELVEMASGINICQKPEAIDTSLSAHDSRRSRNRVRQTNKSCPSIVEAGASECSICLSMNRHKNAALPEKYAENPHELILTNIPGGNSMQAKKTTKRSLRSSTKDLNHQCKPKRTQATEIMNAKSVKVDGKTNSSVGQVLCPKNCEKIPKGQIGTSKDDCGYVEECQSCLILRVFENGSMQNIIYMKWECHRRRLVMMLLLKIAKCLGTHSGKHGTHEIHEVFGQCFSVMFERRSLKSCGMPDFSLLQLVLDESLGDFLRIERAALLYNMSWFFLKDIVSEHPRTSCCSLSKIPAETVIPWLLRAFTFCRQCPLLFQKVSQLISSLLLLSTLGCSLSVPLQTETLSLNHWAAYFHQASVGTYLHWQLYSRKKIASTQAKGFSNASMTNNTAELSNFLRFAPEKLEDLEEHATKFFRSLPSIPVVCISMLGGDYANIVGEMLLLPSFFPAWMLLSRLVGNNQPVVMLLPLGLIEEEIQLEGGISTQKFNEADAGAVKHWHCPWGYSVVDCVVPSFKQLLEEDHALVSNSTFPPADTQMKRVLWWSQRTVLNNCLNKLLRNMENSWLGPWSCLLLGEYSVPRNIDVVIQKLISVLKSQGLCEINYSLINAVISGSKSASDAESCIYQLLLYKGYFGRGACCGKESFRAFSAAPQTKPTTDLIHDLIKEAFTENTEPADREPVIIVPDPDVQMLPWENLPILRNQEVYRMPSVSSIFLTLERSCSHHKKEKAFGTVIPAVDPLNAYYLLNPSGDLMDTQEEFEQWFRNQEWEGKAGDTDIPTTKELILALQNRDLFLYIGHGSGTQYIPQKEIQKLDHCSATFLMGCSSGSLSQRGCYAPEGAVLSYLLAGSPCVIGNLWDVTDKDINRFGKALLNSWLLKQLDSLDNATRDNQLAKQIRGITINSEVPSTSVKATRKGRSDKSRNLFENNQGGFKRNRIVSFMNQARESCKFRMLIGAAPVCYGVPTAIWNRS